MLVLMEPDTAASEVSMDAPEPAHLRLPGDRSHHVWRHPPSPALADLVARYWVPVWSLPAGRTATQQVLQHPVALVVITRDDARFTGVATGMSTVDLVGSGYAVGVLFRPAAGSLLVGGSMRPWTDRVAPLATILGEDAAEGLVRRVRAALDDEPGDVAAQSAAVAAYEDVLARYLPVDDEGQLVNEVVAFVQDTPGVTRVGQVCERFGLGERSLQRLTRRRLGLTPKWLIQRHRLHEATARLQAGDVTLAQVAAELGYADQAHLTRDFRTVVGRTPGEFVRQHRAALDPPPVA